MQRRTSAAVAARPLLLYMLLMARGPRAAHAQGAPGSPARSTVLLVDDEVDSRWTITVAASRLRHDGSGDVLPFALRAR